MNMEKKRTCVVAVEDMGLSSRLSNLTIPMGAPMDVQTACPACETKLETVARIVGHGGEQAIRYGLCPSCGYMGYIDRPEQKWIIDYYSKDWDQEFIRPPEQMRKDADDLLNRRGKMSRILTLDLLGKMSVDKDRPVVEIGSGYGLVLKNFERDGFRKIVGVENSMHRADLVRKIFGFEVLHGGFEEDSVQAALRAIAPIGIFFSHHVFEHTTHPDEIIRKASELQKEGDYLMFALPNADGEHILYALLYLLHLHSFTKESLEALFNRHGYEIVADNSPDPTNLIVAAKKVARPQAHYRSDKNHQQVFLERFRKGFRIDDIADALPYAVYWEQKTDSADTASVEKHFRSSVLTTAWWFARKGIDYVKSRFLKRVTAGHRLLLRIPEAAAPEDGVCEIRFTKDIGFHAK